MISIDYVIEECRRDFKIEDNEKHEPFLERYIAQIPRPETASERAYVHLLEDALLMFSYLIKERKTTENGKEVSINSKARLKLLGPSAGMSACMWQDSRIGQLYARREYFRKKGLPSYKDLINLIGKDEEVKKSWGREINYDEMLRGHHWKKRISHTGILPKPAIPTARAHNYRPS
jgi:hypothetical protein